MSKYDENSIQRHAGLAGIRAKPTVYIGPTDHNGLWTIWREGGDNACDQALAGRNKLVHYIVDKDGSYWVADAGPGIPVGKKEFEDERGRKEKMSTFYVVTGLTHAGANFSGTNISRGTHGIGIKATNALSKSFKAYTKRDGKWHSIEYAKGKLTKDVRAGKPPKLPHGIKIKQGTVLRFEPDPAIFGTAKMPMEDLRSWCRLTSYLVPGLEIKVTNAKGETKTYHSKRGVLDYIDKRLEAMGSEALGKVFSANSKEIDIVLAWTDSEGSDSVEAYTNGLLNRDGGVHLKAVQDALYQSLKEYAGNNEFQSVDLRDGLVGLINYKIAAPKFNNQRKDVLEDERVYEECKKQVRKELDAFWKTHKTQAQQIVKRAAELRAMTVDFLKSKKLVKNVKKAATNLSGKLKDVGGKRPRNECELFLIEGDSAGGCFTADTKILMANGDSLSFKELIKSGRLDGMGFNRTKKKAERINFSDPRITKYVSELIEVTLSDGSTIKATLDHPWLLKYGKYVATENLKVGDDLQTISPPKERKSSGKR